MDIKREEINKILVIGCRMLGDSLDSFSSLTTLKNLFPKAEYHLLAHRYSLDFYGFLNLFNRTFCYDSRQDYLSGKKTAPSSFLKLYRDLQKEKYDLAYILPGGLGHALLAFLLRIKYRIGNDLDHRRLLLTHHTTSSRLENNFTNFSKLTSVLSPGIKICRFTFNGLPAVDIGRENYFTVAPCSSDPKRMWNKERFVTFCREAGKRFGLTPVFLGLEKERAYIETISSETGGLNQAGRHSLAEVFSVIKDSAFFIGNDTGLSHAAGMLDIPTYIIFGPSNPTLARPEGEQVHCVFNEDPAIAHDRRTLKKNQAALEINLVTPGQVLTAIKKDYPLLEKH